MSAVILNLTTPANTGVGTAQERTAIAYENLLTSSSNYTLSANSSDGAFLIDGMTTTSWPTISGSTSIVMNSSPIAGTEIDCIAFAPSNWKAASCGVKIDIETASGTETIFNGSGFRDNAPIMFVFDARTPIEITITLTTSDILYLTGLFVGNCLRFPCGVSVGYQPGRWSSDDKINTFKTESNAFGQSTVFARGMTESATLENLPQEFMNDEWRYFIDNAKGKQIWFSWNFVDYPLEVMYGSWSVNKPSYDSSTYSSVNLTIQGLAS